MLAQPVIKDMTNAERQKTYPGTPENVGYAAYEYCETEQESKVLSAHLLGGINISPCGAPIRITDNIKIYDFKPKQIESAVQTSFEEKSIEVKPSGDAKVEENDEYSDNFEEDDEEQDLDHDDDLLKEFAPKIAAMQEFTDDSLTDRLSAIPEVPSQATSVEEFHKVLEQSPESSSSPSKSSSLITSPIHVPIKLDTEVSQPKEDQRQLKKIEQSESSLEQALDDSKIIEEPKVENELSEGPLDDSSPMLEPRKVSKIETPTGHFNKTELSEGPLDEDSSPIVEQRQVSKIDTSVEASNKTELLSEGPLDDSSPMLEQRQASKIDLSEGPINSEDSLERSLQEGPVSSAMPGNMEKSSSSSVMASSSASLTTCSSLSKSEHLSDGQIVMSVDLSEGELKASTDSLDD